MDKFERLQRLKRTAVQRTGQLGEPSLVYLLSKKRTPEEEEEEEVRKSTNTKYNMQHHSDKRIYNVAQSYPLHRQILKKSESISECNEF